MRRYRVAVFYATEAERRVAVRILGGRALENADAARLEAAAAVAGRDLRRYQGVSKLWCSAGELRRLQAANLTVDVLRQPAAPAADPRMRRRKPVAAELVRQLHARSDRVEIGAGLAVTEGPGKFRESVNNIYAVRLRGPLDDDRRALLDELGIEVNEFEQPDRYWMYLSPDQRTRLTAQDWVLGAEPRGFGDPFSPQLLTELARTDGPGLLGSLSDGDEVAEQYDVLLYRASDLDWVRDTLAATSRTDVLFAVDVMLRFRTDVQGDELSSLLAAVARLHEVRSLTPYRPPKLYVDHARRLIGLEVLAAREPTRWSGEGQLVAIFDSGVDDGHPDLAGRVTLKRALVGTDPVDLLGHGTHVAGIIAGTGAASGGAVTGCAPGATLAVYRVTDDDGHVQVPPSIGLFLRHAADAGAKIINLSWGNALSGPYDTYALSLDQFVYEHPDILVVVAAGNDGQAPKGTHLFNTVGTPATAKNALTVGACETDRTAFAEVTWTAFRHSRFPLPPAGEEHAAGNPDLPAAISSRGPTDYGSIKPELLAPGTFILSTRMRAGRIDPRLIWKDCPEFDNQYVYIGGTSMAAPVVAGAAAVLRHYLTAERGLTAPSAALLKALLIAASHRLPGLRDAGTWADVGYPDFDQGFGRLDLAGVLLHDQAPAGRRIALVDVANDSAEALESYAAFGGARRSGSSYRVTVTAADDPLRIVLAWTDRAAGAVQNNLNLSLIDPDGTQHLGNIDHTYQKGTGFERGESDHLDKLNTVELILLQKPPLGEYRIRVTAQNTVFPPQGYSLVACGQLGSDTLTTEE